MTKEISGTTARQGKTYRMIPTLLPANVIEDTVRQSRIFVRGSRYICLAAGRVFRNAVSI